MDKRVIIQKQEDSWYIFDPKGVQLDGTRGYISKDDAEKFCDNHGLQYKDTGLFVMNK